MPESRMQHYKRTMPSTIYGHHFLDLPKADPSIGGWDPGKDTIQIYHSFHPSTHIECQGAVSCVQYQAIDIGTSVQFQATSTSVGGVSITLAGIDEPITETNLIDNEEKQVMDLIFRVRVLLPVPYSNKLAERLITLFYDAQEEDPLSIGPSIDSLHTFYNFLNMHNSLKMPSISLTPENLIYASWRAGSKVFSVIFFKNEFAQFVVFEPDNRDPSRNVRLSGTIAIENLLQTVKATSVLSWITDDRRQDS